MASGIATVGLVLLVVGILGVALGLGLLVFTQEDLPTNEAGASSGASAENERQGHIAQTVAVGAGAVAFLGLIFNVIGRAD